MYFSSVLHRYLFFFFNDTATTEIYTLSLHDALPILFRFPIPRLRWPHRRIARSARIDGGAAHTDRKSTRLNSSHLVISYAVFCLKKKNMCEPSLSYLRMLRLRALPQRMRRP